MYVSADSSRPPVTTNAYISEEDNVTLSTVEIQEGHVPPC